MNKHRGCLTLLLLVSFLGTIPCGCGRPKGRPTVPTEFVEGAVTLNGNPLAKADIMFIAQSPEAENATALSGEDGNFVLTSLNGEPGKGALPGEYKITVSKVETRVLAKPKKDPNLGEVWTEDTQLVPAVYQNAEKTPLQATIRTGKNTVALTLEGK